MKKARQDLFFTTTKMAAGRNHRLLVLQMCIQFFPLISLILQLHGLVITYKILEMKRNLMLCALFSAKKSKLQRKMKHIQARRILRRPRSTWVANGRTDQWWQNMLGADVPEYCWKKNFRMSRISFMALADELRPAIGPRNGCPNYQALTTEKKLAITLYYLKDTGSLWMTANTFGIHQCTVSKTVSCVCSAICKNLGPKYLHLPRDKEEMRQKVSEFELKFGMIQAFGCIDGTHIPIKRPVRNSQDYFNYKQFFSLNIQAVCDANGQFINVECKWPGSVHDAKVFANSDINMKLNTAQLPLTFNTVLPGFEAVPNYLIGDPAYPLTPFCMKEFQTCANNEEVLFNTLLRSARNQIECAFGRLKARWRFLTRVVDIRLEMVPTVAHSCFILHNYCERNGNRIDEDEIQAQVLRHQIEERRAPNTPDPVYSSNNGEGEYVRSILKDYVKQNLPDSY